MARFSIFLIARTADAPGLAGVQSGVISALAGTSGALVLHAIDPGNALAVGELVETLCAFAPAGAVLMPCLAGEALPHAIAAAGTRFVQIAPDGGESADHLVCSNDRLGMRDAANYLISLGHRRIGLISISDASAAARERELGFLDAMAEHGLNDAELIAPADDTVEGDREAGELLMSVSPRPSAVLASSDIQAAGMLQVARLREIAVPGALSVMGLGDGELATVLAPPLTTMRLPWAQMGFTAAVKLLDPARAARQPVEFFCELVRRGSTGPVGG